MKGNGQRVCRGEGEVRVGNPRELPCWRLLILEKDRLGELGDNGHSAQARQGITIINRPGSRLSPLASLPRHRPPFVEAPRSLNMPTCQANRGVTVTRLNACMWMAPFKVR